MTFAFRFLVAMVISPPVAITLFWLLRYGLGLPGEGAILGIAIVLAPVWTWAMFAVIDAKP